VLALLFGATDPTAAPIARAAQSAPWWLAMLAFAVGPAVNEELWFRGYLGRGLVGRYGPTAGVLLASLFFGLVHVHPVQAAYAALMGLWLHFAYRMTRSLWVPVLVHFLNNGLAVVAALLAGGASAAADAPPAPSAAVLWGIGVAAVAVLAAASWGLYKLRVR
jgi:membrane protease YdiL (CAAX protease family)